MPEIDWMKSSREDRQVLYRYLKAEIDRRDMTIYQMIEEATGSVMVGHGYDANMRSGRFSRKNAFQFFDWLEEKNSARAASVIGEILSSENWESAGAWHQLVGGGNSGHIAIIEHPERQHLVKFADEAHFQKIERGKPFFLRVNLMTNGFAIGFQQVKSLWYPLPLGRAGGWVPVKDGNNNLPSRDDGTVDPLMEDTETGRIEFKIIFSIEYQEYVEQERTDMPLPRQKLDAFAGRLKPSPQPHVYSSSVLII